MVRENPARLSNPMDPGTRSSSPRLISTSRGFEQTPIAPGKPLVPVTGHHSAKAPVSARVPATTTQPAARRTRPVDCRIRVRYPVQSLMNAAVVVMGQDQEQQLPGLQKNFISLRIRCEKTQHPGSAGSCQPSETGLATAWARAVDSATCRPAEFLYPPRSRRSTILARNWTARPRLSSPSYESARSANRRPRGRSGPRPRGRRGWSVPPPTSANRSCACHLHRGNRNRP